MKAENQRFAFDIALIGTGLLGTALAERLIGAGLRVNGFDVRESQRAPLLVLGASFADSLESAVASAPVIVLSLPTSTIVGAVVGETRESLRGKTIIDTTTGDPEETAALGAGLFAHGVDYLDATVAGSSEQVRQGEAIVMVGGQTETFVRAQSLLATFSRQAYHVGPWGGGARMKLVVNLALGLNRAVLAESLALARASGIDLSAALAILQDSPAYSRVMDTKGRKMIEGEFSPQARLRQHLKDVHLILEQGARAGVVLPLSQLHEELLTKLDGAGLGDADNSAIFRAYDDDSSSRPTHASNC